MEKAKQGGDVFSKLSFMKTNAAATYVDGDVMKEMNRPKFDTVKRIQENTGTSFIDTSVVFL